MREKVYVVVKNGLGFWEGLALIVAGSLFAASWAVMLFAGLYTIAIVVTYIFTGALFNGGWSYWVMLPAAITCIAYYVASSFAAWFLDMRHQFRK